MNSVQLLRMANIRSRTMYERLGQAVFNIAWDHFPKETDELRGKEFDCYYNDDLVLPFLQELFRRVDENRS